MIILFVFTCLFIFNLRDKSVATYLYAMQVVSLCGVFFIEEYYILDSFNKYFNAFFTIFILFIIISPWTGHKNINEIVYLKKNKLKRFTNFLLVISFVIFISLSVISVFVFTYFDQINELKYSGNFMDLLYVQFPFFVKGYLLAYYLHPLSYFLIVLHFYYLKYNNKKMAIFCFILSLNLILYGLTFFSRWTLVNYILVYGVLFFLFKNSIPFKIRKKIVKVSNVLALILVFVFVSISVSRFDNDISYANKIPRNSKIQDPTAYSLFDYLSQSHQNGMKILDDYTFNTFNGQNSFSSVLKLLPKSIGFGELNYAEDRKKLLPDNYWRFNGLVAELVYDFGYILTLILALLYHLAIKKLKPKENSISLIKAFLLILLLQVPLLAIFYSPIASLLIPLLFLIPIYFFLYQRRI
jgi:oligosaccharide repeat unit polymerase